MTRICDLKTLHKVYENKARIATTRVAETVTGLNRCEERRADLERRASEADETFEKEVARLFNTAQNAAHFQSLPTTIAILKLRHKDEIRVLEHHRNLVKEEIDELEAELQKRKSAAFAANAKVEKLAAISARMIRVEMLHAEERDDEEVMDAQNNREHDYAT